MQRFINLFIFINCSTSFRQFLRPSSGAQTVHTGSGIVKPILLPAAIVDEIEIQFHLIHDSGRQQYWFDDTWRCMYSFVFLMMGLKHIEQFIEISRSRKRRILLVVL
jgi:hypothetical protein